MMPIIDAHLHFSKGEGFDQIAKEAGHENIPQNLLEWFDKLHIVGAVAMGSSKNRPPHEVYCSSLDLCGPLDFNNYNQPPQIGYCAGIESNDLNMHNLPHAVEEMEFHLQHDHCLGIKLYPGYNFHYVSDAIYEPFYDLARRYHVPVAVHMGDPSSPQAILKYAHPLSLDEAAVRHPDITFVMCHFGAPWVTDAAEVVYKNPNVYTDLSGLAAGQFCARDFMADYAHFAGSIMGALQYMGCYQKVLYGSDWPLVNLKSNIDLIAALVPQKYHQDVFCNNALSVYTRLQKYVNL